MIKARMSTGLRGTTHCMTWLGAKAGIFAKHGIDVTFPTFEVGGPESAVGLVRGQWEFVQTGTVPMTEAVLNGDDAVILLRNCYDHVSTFIMTSSSITQLEDLKGRNVGVLTDAYSGQTGVIMRKTLEALGVTANYVGLGTYQNIYSALAAGAVDAGALQIDLRFTGERRYGWNAFDTRALGLPSIFGTTRRLIAQQPELVSGAVAAVLETIHLFKTKPATVLPLLSEFLGIDDADVVRDIHRHYVPLFPEAPAPNLHDAMAPLRELFLDRYPAVNDLKEHQIADVSVLESVLRTGFVEKLYGREMS